MVILLRVYCIFADPLCIDLGLILVSCDVVTVGDKDITISRYDKETIITEEQYITTKRELQPEQREMPARVVRPDRPEIQLEIQQARMVPIIPESAEVQKGEPVATEHQVLLDRQEPPVFTKPLRPARITEGNPVQ